MARQLEVWLLGTHVGTLSQTEGRLGFVYAPGATTPVSHSLPLQTAPFDDRATRPFFAGLLPEGGKRKQIAKTLQISTQNDYALLDSLGGECAGAGLRGYLSHHEGPGLRDAHEARRLNSDYFRFSTANPAIFL